MLLIPLEIFAAGFYIPGLGSRALSRGGAFVASGEDLISIWHNPANLSRLKGFNFSFDNALTSATQSFKRAKDPKHKKEFPTVENTGTPYYVPFAGISYDFSFLKLPPKHRLVGTFAFWAPYDVLYDYKGDDAHSECTGANKDKFYCTKNGNGPQRYQSISNIPFQLFFGWSLAYAIRLGPVNIRLGGVFQIAQTRVQQTMATQAIKGSTLSDSNDIIINLDASSPFTPSGNFGLTIDLPLGLSVGASFKTSYSVSVKGKLNIKMPKMFEKIADLKGDAGALDFTMPWMMNVGILYKPTFFPRLELEVALVHEAWSSIDGFTLSSPEGDNQISFKDLSGKRASLAPITLPRDWVNTWSVRAGAQFAVIPKHLFIRAGWYYETSAVPTNRADTAVAHNERHAVTAGIEGRFKAGPVNMAIHAAYSHSFGKTLNITDSKVTGVVLIKSKPEETTEVVGNGEYKYQVNVFLLTLALQF